MNGIRYIIFAALLSCCSCAQLSLFQDARTLGKGKVAVGGLASAYGTTENISNYSISFPYVLGHASYGLSDRLDIQTSLSIARSIMISPKYQILGTKESRWALALNPGAEIHSGGLLDSDLIPIRLNYSCIASYHPSDKAAFFLQPSFIHQFSNDKKDNYFVGATAGIKFILTNTRSFSLGSSFYKISHNSDYFMQLGLGMTFIII